MCGLFIGQKFCKEKITLTPALYPSSKNTNSGVVMAQVVASPACSSVMTKIMFTMDRVTMAKQVTKVMTTQEMV